jgi:hypothetical protein
MICGLLAVHMSAAAPRAEQPAEATKAAPAYRLFRYDEDYRYLADPSQRSDFWDPVKYIPLDAAGDWFVSFGGELRERFEYYSKPNLGLQGQHADDYLLQRALLHADLHAGDYLRGFVQLGSHEAWWKDFAAPPYLDRLDVQQAFGELRFPLTGDPVQDPFLRIGRQEMAFGSQRLVAIRDAPNVRRNFDGIRAGGNFGNVRLDMFALRPVELLDGRFDDRSNRRQAFWGLYSTVPMTVIPGGKADFYYLGLENDAASFAAGTAEEERHTVGSRFFGAHAGWDWDWEVLGQVGRFGRQDIRAWGASTDTGYTVDADGWTIRLGLKADIGSGDDDLDDGTLGTLNPYFPKLAYFNQAAILGPSNVMDLQPSLTFKPTPTLTFTTGYGFLWRATTADAIYTGTGAPIAGTAGESGPYTGSQLSLDLAWQASRHVEFGLGYVHLEAGAALRDAGGHDVDFAYFSTAYRF